MLNEGAGRVGARLMFAWHGFADSAQEGAGVAGTEVIVVRPGEFEALLAGASRQPRERRA